MNIYLHPVLQGVYTVDYTLLNLKSYSRSKLIPIKEEESIQDKDSLTKVGILF